jgi:hypothetical protein
MEGPPLSRDANHEDIVLAFRRASAYVIDLHSLGRDKPDLLVGFAGTERLVEIKTEADARPVRERMRPSARCDFCGKSYRSHRLGRARKRDLSTGERFECTSFVVKLIPAPRSGGQLSKGQAAFAREWPGSPIEVVRSKDDVGRVLGAMVASTLARRRGDAR